MHLTHPKNYPLQGVLIWVRLEWATHFSFSMDRFAAESASSLHTTPSHRRPLCNYRRGAAQEPPSPPSQPHAAQGGRAGRPSVAELAAPTVESSCAAGPWSTLSRHPNPSLERRRPWSLPDHLFELRRRTATMRTASCGSTGSPARRWPPPPRTGLGPRRSSPRCRGRWTRR